MELVIGLVKRFPIWTAIGVLALGGYVFRDYLSGSAHDLAVGDCFEEPAEVTTGAGVKDVQHRPCSQAHDAEVFFVGNVSGGEQFAGDAAFEAYVRDSCLPEFQRYIGSPYETDRTYDIAWLEPTIESWAEGDREIACYVVRMDGSRLTGSVRVEAASR